MKAIQVFDEISRCLKREYHGHGVRAIDSMIFLTYRCTSRCRTCNIWRRNDDECQESELNWEQWQIVLTRLRDYGIKSLEIFGGDALLRKDLIFNIIKFCKKNGIETFFPTNSLLMDRDTAKELVDSGLDVIYISLDDIGSRHDEIRGKDGTFKLVRNTIENIASERSGGKTPRIIVCTTISNLNYKRFAEIAEFLEDYPVDTIYPRVLGEFDKDSINNSAVKGIRPEPYFTSSDQTSHLLKEDEAREFRDAIKKIKSSRKSNRIYINFRAIDEAGDQALTKGIHALKKCLLCSTFVTVDPYGNVIPCPMYNKYTLGNLLEDGLEAIWGNDNHQFFIKEQKRKKIEICKNCIMRIYYPNLPETCAYLLKRTKEKALNFFGG